MVKRNSVAKSYYVMIMPLGEFLHSSSFNFVKPCCWVKKSEERAKSFDNTFDSKINWKDFESSEHF